ncbi:hypothetical protein BH10CHL1_BH10CHL1_31870 [soil metagenome]
MGQLSPTLLNNLSRNIHRHWRTPWLLGVLALYLALTMYQLGLPGLHYDEAREAGVNAMEILTGAPVTAFRGVTVNFWGQPLPLMVQDYIGALNVYLALPLLALTGAGVPNLRMLSILTGLVALLLLERAVSEWQAGFGQQTELGATPSARFPTPLSRAGLLTITLLAASPSFVFWSRQGIFVTNLTQPLSFWCIWQGLRWLRTGHAHVLVISAFAGGLAIYAKLLALWVIGPFALLAAGWWFWQRIQQRRSGAIRQTTVPQLSFSTTLGMLLALILPLLPLLFFYLHTGAASDILHKLDQSYYGIDNRDWLTNLFVRWSQLLQSLRGDHLWYLGGIYGNASAPWLAGIALLGGLWRDWRRVAPIMLLLLLTFACSLFTISSLFVTHYAVVQPLLVASVGVGLSTWWMGQQQVRWALLPSFALCAVLIWFSLDLAASLRYHAALSQSGGLADHSDATYHLAYYLRYHGEGSPIALDWGLDAPVRYLSQGTVTPIEIFGYASPSQPDAAFAQRLQPFLADPNNVYLLHTPNQTIFTGRRELFIQMAKAANLRLVQETQFSQRNGQGLFELWRAVP